MKKTTNLLFFTAVFSLLFTTTALSQDESCTATCLSGNCENGFGKYKFEDCTIYEGYFKNYKLYGKGKYTYGNGNTYDGDWVDAIRQGQGLMNYASGERYNGKWSNNKRNGFGEYTWKDGTRYEGYWVDDIMKGQATIYYPSGEKYVGENNNGSREGKGIHYNANGTVFYDGYWTNNSKSTEVTEAVNEEEQYDDEDWWGDWLDEDEEEEQPAETEEKVSYKGETTQGTSSGNFCTDYKNIAATAKESFKPIEGSKRSEEGDVFKTNVYNTTKSIAGAKDCYIQNVLGIYYYAIFGEYNTQAEAETKFNEIQGKVKSCLPDKIYEYGKTTEYISRSLSIITKYADGFDLYGDNLDIYNNKTTGKYSVRLSISTGFLNSRVYNITSSGGSGDTHFDGNLKKILESSRDKFTPVLGEKHEQDGFFGKTTTWDVNASLPGISSLSYTTGGFSFSDDLIGVNYEGTDLAEAKKRYDALSEKVKKSLGSSYVFIKSESPEGEILRSIFALKSEMKSDKTPVVTVKYYYDKSGNKCSVKIEFAYKGFGGIL